MRTFTMIVVGLSCLAGCGGGTPPVCTAGTTQNCTCTVGKGTQTCAADGSAWGACGQCTVTAAEACTSEVGTVCDKMQQCMGWFVTLIYGDAATCKTRGVIGCADWLAADGTAAKPNDIQACSDAYAKLSCDEVLAGTKPAACNLAKGTLADGKACGSDLQCKSGDCRFSASATCGTCSPMSAAGSSCANGEQCQDGLKCAKNGICVVEGAAGATCSENAPCKAPLGCLQGTCVTPVGAGASCGDTVAVCDSTAGLFCLSSTCQLLSYADPGKPCGFIGSGITACSAAGHCNVPTGSFSGTCMAAAADGATCSDTNGPSCMVPAACIGGTCQLRGMSCK